MAPKQQRGAATTAAVPAALPFANDGSFMEQFLKMQAAQAQQEDKRQGAAHSDTLAGPAPQGEQDTALPFIPSRTFSAPKPGYVFKTGSQGTGYYKDEVPTAGAETVAEPPIAAAKVPGKAVILKSKPIINVQRRPSSSAEPAAKKKKSDEDDSKPHYLKEMDRYRSTKCGSDTNHERPLVK
eukprot:jgi/Tetstr1/466336/TSEL_010866.t1